MKVVYIDYQYHYGKKELGFNSIAVDGFVASFEKLGHEVIPFFYDDLVEDLDLLHKKMKEFCYQNKPDLIFFVLAQDLFDSNLIKDLSSDFTTVNFFGDDHWRFESFTKKLAHSFSYCVTTDPLALAKYNDIGIDNVILSQWAAIDFNESEIEHDGYYKYDVSFVGGKSPFRSWVVDYLAKKGIKVSCFGVGWDSGPIPSDEMSQVFKETKINLNLSNSCSYDIRFFKDKPFTFMRQLLRSSKTSSQVKARNFEIPALNGFQLTDYVPFLDRYLKIGEEVACFNNVDELADLIKYYINFEEEREKIKQASHSRMISEHFYINRVNEILNNINIDG